MKITSFLLACVACGTLNHSNQVFSQPSASPRLQTEEGERKISGERLRRDN